MKKILFFVFMALTFAACEQALVEEQSAIRHEAPETLTVGFEDDETRIQLNEAQKTVWTKDDLVSVFYRSDANQKWQYQGETGERVAELTRVEAGVATEAMKRVVVVYPYSENYYINTETYNVQATLPAVQNYLKDSYGLDGNIMISSSEYNQFSLKSVCGWLKLQLTGNGEKVKSITLRGNNGEQVAGELYINSADATSILASDSGASDDDSEAGGSLIFEDTILTEVTLDCGTGVKLGAEATAFYIALPPQTFENGFTVEIEAMDGSIMTKSTDKTLTIERNHIQPMVAFAYDGVEQTNVIRYTATRKIEPHSGDWGANLISNDWNEHTGKGIITFDGEVTKIPNYAFGTGWIDWMKSIIIPSSVTVIGDGAFSGMSLNHGVLEDIIFAKNSKLEKIGDGAFKLNASLKAIVLPSSVKEIGDGICLGCGALKGVYLNNDYYGTWHFGSATALYRYADGHYHILVFPSVFAEMDRYINAIGGATNIDYGAISQSNITSFSWSWIVNIASYNFANCDDLTSIDLYRTETIGEYVIYMCDKLSSIDLPVAKEIGANCLMQNDALTTINLGCDALTTINRMGYSCPSLKTIHIPSGVTSISSSFNDCTAINELYVKAAIPPTLTDSFDSMVAPTIYVPVEAFYLYKSAEGWKDFADYIVGYDFETGEVVEELQKPITYDWYTEVTDGYYEIDAPEELIALSKLCNGDAEALSTVGISEAATFENATIDITADINLINYCNFEVGSWEPIGTFSGTFNGNNHTISNLYYNKTNVASASVGLFANVSNAFIRDITVDGEIHISGDTFDIGGIAARSSNTLFENCISSVDITSDNEGMGCHIGGVCGSDSSYYNSFSTFIACQSDAYIKNTQDEWEWYNNLGGIVGSGNYAKIIACIKQGGCVFEENTQSYTPVGGICGYADYSNDFRIIACYSNTEIDGRMPGHILGACSYRGYYSPNSGTKKIKDCYYAGTSHENYGDKGVGSDNYGGSTYSRDDGTARSSDIAAEIEIMNAAIEEWNMSAFHTCYYRYTIDNNNNLVLVHQNYL